jgi:hypothetical protein
MTGVQNLQYGIAKLKINVQTSLESLSSAVQVAVADLDANSTRGPSSLHHCLNAIRQQHTGNSMEASELSLDLKKLVVALKRMESQCASLSRQQRILKSLYFNAIPTRHDNVEQAHAKTFTWLFDPSNPDAAFVDWLACSNDNFWVQGKAGSGKSTLMKFICAHTQTNKLLTTWAGESKLVTAKFFFWQTGTPLQKSQEGLLRTLLFEIFRQCPELIEPVCGDHYRDHSELTVGGWSLEDLLDAFHDLMSQALSTKFCFFIDGLDEFNGEPGALVDILQCISNHSDIKMCVSSRPWPVFLYAFGENTKSLIKLEDLTKGDIRRYAEDRLQRHDLFQQQIVDDPAYKELIEIITTKAQGVFLWVFLVVRSLLETLTQADDLLDLHLRLEQLPDDLEGFFQHMIDSVPKLHRSQTARTFKLALAAGKPLKLMTYSFMDDLEKDPAWAFKLETQPMSRAEIQLRCNQMKLRLNGRCKGLLGIYAKSGAVSELPEDVTLDHYEVDFMHRTVREFLQGSGGDAEHQLFLNELQCASSDFDVNVILCGTALAAIKVLPVRQPLAMLCDAEKEWINAIRQDLWETVESLIRRIAKARKTQQRSMTEEDQMLQYVPSGYDIACEADPVLGTTTHVKLKFPDGSRQVVSWVRG